MNDWDDVFLVLMWIVAVIFYGSFAIMMLDCAWELLSLLWFVVSSPFI